MTDSNIKISEYFLPLLKDVSEDVKLISHKYCIRAGLIKQSGSGMYTWLPLGLRVMQNISKIVREIMNKSGAIELLMPCIQQASLWEESGRLNDYGEEMLKIKDRHGVDMLFGPTNEELITNTVKHTLKSYKDFPKNLYHIQWKFRDEIRPRFGLMRAREFLMKDAYSFAKNQEEAIFMYDTMYVTYLKIFKALGLDVIVSKADTGPIGGDLSHEFHLITNDGAENTIYHDKKLIELIQKFYNAKSEEELYEIVSEMKNVYSVVEDLHVEKNDNLLIKKGIEVGHIFYFGNKYSKTLQHSFSLKDGSKDYSYMGSYGIGISRLVAAIIEYSHDEKGIIWPEQVAPFKFGLINLNKDTAHIAEKIFTNLKNVIYDDTTDSIGTKFSKMDLIGIPYQIIIGKEALTTSKIELKSRKTGEINLISINEFVERENQQPLSCNS